MTADNPSLKIALDAIRADERQKAIEEITVWLRAEDRPEWRWTPADVATAIEARFLSRDGDSDA